jgi:hypothetical protein
MKWEFINTSGSVISIPHKYYGEEIKRGSFRLKTDYVDIRDDSHGNLYAKSALGNNLISQSSATSISSSDNYVGNIFYDLGLVTLTTTESYSSGRAYHHATTGSYNVNFESTHTIYTREYTVVIKPSEFNHTFNVTARTGLSGSDAERLHWTHPAESPMYKSDVRFSVSQSFSPYITKILLWDDWVQEPVICAKFKHPIKKPTNVPIIFKIRVDWL